MSSISERLLYMSVEYEMIRQTLLEVCGFQDTFALQKKNRFVERLHVTLQTECGYGRLFMQLILVIIPM